MAMQGKFFNLQEGEEIIKDIKPEKGLLWYFLIPSIVAAFFVFMFFVPFVLQVSLSPASSEIGFILLPIALFFLIIILVVIIVPFLRYGKQYYWITNKRVIYKHGMIGYRISSIPLERISDVIISRSLIEKIFGFGSIHIQSLAGQFTYGTHVGSEGALLAVPDPEGTQELIFKLVQQKRKDEKLTF